MSSVVLYIASEARAVAGTPKRSITGWAQWWPVRIATPSRSTTVPMSCGCTSSMTNDRMLALRRAVPMIRTPGTPPRAAVAAEPGVRIVGTAARKASMLSFVMDGIHPHDIGTVVDREGVAIRTGHHCAQPVMDRYGIPATARASFAMYNTMEDADRLVSALQKTIQVFR